jgi:hypothetical protein
MTLVGKEKRESKRALLAALRNAALAWRRKEKKRASDGPLFSSRYDVLYVLAP